MSKYYFHRFAILFASFICCINIHGYDTRFTINGLEYELEQSYYNHVSVIDYHYRNYTIVDIPDSVTYDNTKYEVRYINTNTFYRDTLQRITIPNTIVSIRKNAFQNSYIDSLIIKKGDNSINLFNYDGGMTDTDICYFNYVYIGRTLSSQRTTTEIKVKRIDLENNINIFAAIDFPFTIGTLDILPGTNPIDLDLNTIYMVGGTKKVNNECSINELCINRPISKVTTDSSICNTFRSISFLENITEIPLTLFEACNNLEYLYLNNRITNFDYKILRNSGVQLFEMEDGFLGYYLDRNNGLLFDDKTTTLYFVNRPSEKQSYDHIVMPQSVTNIAKGACMNINIDTFEAPGLLSVDDNAFNGSHLKNIIFNKPLQNVGAYSFANCDLTEINLHDNIDSYPDGLFYNCPNLELPEGHLEHIKHIGNGTFFNWLKLKSLTFGDDLKSIGDSAFCDCINLDEVKFNHQLESIGHHAFENCIKVKELTFHENIKSIGRYAFSANVALEKVTINSAIDSISAGTFSYCFNLEQPQLPENVTKIGDRAFYQCLKFTDMQLDNITSIGSEAYARCNLSYIVIGSKLKHLGSRAFALNNDLKTVQYNTLYPISAPDDVFSNYEMAFLTIPQDSFNNFWNTCPWNKFKYIQEVSSISSNDMINYDNTDLPIQYFDLTGRQVENPAPGIYILLQGNTTRKVMIR